MKNILLLLLFAFLTSGFSACQTKEQPAQRQIIEKPYDNDSFSDYWYAGKAEVASYNLKQVRYGEIHDGKAVLIFVTEPFSKEKHVKLDDPKAAGDDEVTVMKLNYTKKFNTGIYPYSMMLSAFTPVELNQYPASLKVTMSSQEWCGHVFSQMNLKKNKYEVSSYSYFEQEGDTKFNVDATLLEDEIWNRIRLNYKSLPTGEITIIPGLFFTRMKHENLKPVTGQAKLNEKEREATYQIEYPQYTLAITFSTSFPYKILSWEEVNKSANGETLTTTATFDKMLHIDYWTMNKNADGYLRDSLNLK